MLLYNFDIGTIQLVFFFNLQRKKIFLCVYYKSLLNLAQQIINSYNNFTSVRYIMENFDAHKRNVLTHLL